VLENLISQQARNSRKQTAKLCCPQTNSDLLRPTLNVAYHSGCPQCVIAAAIVGMVGKGAGSGWWHVAVDELSASYLLLINPRDANAG